MLQLTAGTVFTLGPPFRQSVVVPPGLSAAGLVDVKTAPLGADARTEHAASKATTMAAIAPVTPTNSRKPNQSLIGLPSLHGAAGRPVTRHAANACLETAGAPSSRSRF